jgi:hypothetical protein
MNSRVRKLNDAGVAAFRAYIKAGAADEPPVHLLTNLETSDPLSTDIAPLRSEFSDRFVFGKYLCDLLRPLEATGISSDQGLWSGLALYWFELLCPARGNSMKRSPDKDYRYVLSADYRHYYRHLVRTPWQLVNDHGEFAKCLLISPRNQSHPLSVGGEILEQIGSRQSVLGSPSIIEAVHTLYFDPDTERPKRGAAGSAAGSARRLGIVLRQLDLNFDAQHMQSVGLLTVLPSEFNRWAH